MLDSVVRQAREQGVASAEPRLRHGALVDTLSELEQDVRLFVYSWVNDEDTKRAYESSNDAYRTFRRLLESGNPPDDWETLLKQAKTQTKRLRKVRDGAK